MVRATLNRFAMDLERFGPLAWNGLSSEMRAQARRPCMLSPCLEAMAKHLPCGDDGTNLEVHKVCASIANLLNMSKYFSETAAPQYLSLLLGAL